MRMDNRDSWISIKTTDKDKATEIAEAAVNAQIASTTLAKTEAHVGEIGREIGYSMTAEVTGRENTRIKIEQAHGIWAGLTADYKRPSEPTQSFYKAIFKRLPPKLRSSQECREGVRFAGHCGKTREDARQERNLDKIGGRIIEIYGKTNLTR